MQEKQTKKDFFNNSAKEWDIKELPQNLLRIDNIFEEYDINPTGKILDVGCGTGILVPVLLSRSEPPFTIFELDFSLEMLRENHAKNLKRSHLNFINGNALKTPVPDQTFQWIIALAVLPHLGDSLDAIHEWSRIISPGGTLVLLHLMNSQELNEFHAQLDGIVKHDRLAPVTELANLFSENGWVIELKKEQKELYLLKARKL